MKDYYKLLEVDYTASNQELSRAFRKKVLILHPDIKPDKDPSEFHEMMKGFHILSDMKKRFEYNQQLIKYYQEKKKTGKNNLLKNILHVFRV
ncbi:MAG: DnaJ domain-containing protein [Spirochaetes bacterium]|nr:DnaJ domain-containing protein [Spirochaetota bacterium]